VTVASLALWLAAQFDKRIALSAYPGPDHVWFFNPFAWQALFFLGAWLGWRGQHGGVPWLRYRWLFYFAALLAVAGFVIRLSWTLHDFYDPFPVAASGDLLWPFLSKGDLGFLRFASVLVVAFLVSRLIHPRARFFASRGAQLFLICGRNSLHIFCLAILLSVLAHLVLNEFFGGTLMQIAVSAAGIAIMIGVAALMEWFAAAQRGSGSTALRAPVTAGGPRG
jgi:hypothetical protein